MLHHTWAFFHARDQKSSQFLLNHVIIIVSSWRDLCFVIWVFHMWYFAKIGRNKVLVTVNNIDSGNNDNSTNHMPRYNVMTLYLFLQSLCYNYKYLWQTRKFFFKMSTLFISKTAWPWHFILRDRLWFTKQYVFSPACS